MGYKKIVWTSERLDEAVASKKRWLRESLSMDELMEELIFTHAEFMNGTTLEEHLEFWLYTYDRDKFLEYTWKPKTK